MVSDSTSTPIKASVVVRSYYRRAALIELVKELQLQRFDDFEIVIVEQSDDAELVAELEALEDPRVRVIASPPLGAPGARNEGIRHARGEILVFVDDDDLPVGEDWIASHVANYADPNCMGVTGRLTSDPKKREASTKFPQLIRWLTMRHTPFKDPWTFPYGSLRKEGAAFLIGNNFSVRRSLVERIGGWDEGIPMHEEHSFAFKFARAGRPGEHFIYDPAPLVWRRLAVKGGLDRRTRTDSHLNELRGRIIYYHDVVGHYFPIRFRMFYPLFLLRSLEQVLLWIWDPDNRDRGFAERVRQSVQLFTAMPRHVWRDGLNRSTSAQRVPDIYEDKA